MVLLDTHKVIDTDFGTLISNVLCKIHKVFDVIVRADEVKGVSNLHKPEEVHHRDGLQLGFLIPNSAFSATSCRVSLE